MAYRRRGGQRPRSRPNLGERRRRSAAGHRQSTADVSGADVLTPQAPKLVVLPPTMTVKELADALELGPVQVIKGLLNNGIIASINQRIDLDTAAVVATDLGFEVRELSAAAEEEPAAPEEGAAGPEAERARVEGEASLVPRPPVVTVMGHVDHGKTALLDAIRKTNVMSMEAGGITQHIGAYQVEIHGNRITFLDTPGHEAFTAMRARGAQVTDVAVLVVAADDGVMPQTKEAIAHAHAARVPIVVALNKIDKPTANVERVKQQLAEAGLLIEEYGGQVPLVPVSAKKSQGIEDLLEIILLVAEMADLRAPAERPASGVVIEAKLDKARGPLATVLVQEGVLKLGDTVVVGGVSGRVKALFNDKGKRMKRADPSTPVAVLGLSGVPLAGDKLRVVADEKVARAVAVHHQQATAQGAAARTELSLEDLFAKARTGQEKELSVILKTDVQGSIEPIASSLQRLEVEDVKVNIVHSGTGNVTESDVMLAAASRATIIAFNVRLEPGASKAAEAQGVQVRHYGVIYELVEDIQRALTGLLEPRYRETVLGHAEVRQLFRIPKGQVAAGCAVLDGVVVRGYPARVLRNGATVYEGRIAGLRRFKEDAREVAVGYECGISLDEFSDFQVGDVIEAYGKEQVA